MGKRIIGIVLVLLCGARVALAQVTTQTVHRTTNVTVTLPSNIGVGGQYYDASVGGIEGFMAQLRVEDPAIWAQLESDAARLRTRQNWSYLSAIGGGAIGLGLLAAAPAFASHHTDEFGIQVRDENWQMMAVGGGVIAVSLAVAAIVIPKRGDMLDFVNKYNRLRPNSPMQLQLGLTGGPGNVACAATITF